MDGWDVEVVQTDEEDSLDVDDDDDLSSVKGKVPFVEYTSISQRVLPLESEVRSQPIKVTAVRDVMKLHSKSDNNLT